MNIIVILAPLLLRYNFAIKLLY